MDQNKWYDTKYSLPPEGVSVVTKISDETGERNLAILKRKKNLWFFNDMSMYVYYIPTHWKMGGIS